jgi:hypothetical protein
MVPIVKLQRRYARNSQKIWNNCCKKAVVRLEGMKEFPKDVFSDSNKLVCGSAFNKRPCIDSIYYLIK